MTDWMIILVETPEGKKGNKFPLRTTVLDKLKQDIGGKTPERCVSVTGESIRRCHLNQHLSGTCQIQVEPTAERQTPCNLCFTSSGSPSCSLTTKF